MSAPVVAPHLLQSLAFVIPGDPVPAQMGRVMSNGRTTKPPRVKEYQTHAKFHTLLAVRTRAWEATREESFAVTLRVFVGDARVIDCDNIAKSIGDALKGVAFPDDRQIVELHVYKRIDRGQPRVEVMVERVT